MNRLCVLMILLACVGCVCERSSDTYDEDFVRQVDSIVNADRSIDSLVVVLERFEEDGNEYGIVASCRELGRSYRNASMFSEALDIHKKGLSHAQELKDTISIIQALNNIGTDFRRMGILDEASDYHYQALGCSSVYSDTTSQIAIKNRVISLNGIGNVHLSLGNHEVAETVFRQALAGEASLGSFLGQAINYANIGAILESRGQIDSARYYYSESLRCNMEAGSIWGSLFVIRISAGFMKMRAALMMLSGNIR
ncbi:MAG: tetratricopeptide repeat protein [Bacteroidales bacterium]|nr:tetratricopeptide repeat protein [Bacteroidales bacterium]